MSHGARTWEIGYRRWPRSELPNPLSKFASIFTSFTSNLLEVLIELLRPAADKANGRICMARVHKACGRASASVSACICISMHALHALHALHDRMHGWMVSKVMRFLEEKMREKDSLIDKLT